MRTVIIIQARMGSTRLPGKVLFQLQGKSVLAHVLDRCRKVGNATRIVVATTTGKEDDAIVKECEKLGIACFRGSEQDVLSRYYETAKQAAADIVVRVTSDCPLLDPSLCEAVITSLLEHPEIAYASNDLERTYPRGLDVEAFRYAALEDAYFRANEPYQREHVTPFVYETAKPEQLHCVMNELDYSNHRWTLDTPEDWTFIQELYNKLAVSETNYSWKHAIAIMNEYPELSAINSHVEQKATVNVE